MSRKNISPSLANPLKTSVRAALGALVALGLMSSGQLGQPAHGQQTRYKNSDEFAQHARKLRETALMKMERLEPRVQIGSPSSRTPNFSTNTTGSSRFLGSGGRHPWKTNIVTTVFWVGERPTARNPVANHASSWDSRWAANYGGYDDPDPARRRGFIPASFVPKQNPFYVALPYNDVTRGTTKPEARFVIPWFKQEFERPGKSVCKGRWIAIRKGNRVCYAQWEDCGPFRTDHWQYVFGKERPKSNINQGAGLDVSPAVRDYLGMNAGKDVCDWKFVELHEIPQGPWARYGENNHFVMNARGKGNRLVKEVKGGRGPTVYK